MILSNVQLSPNHEIVTDAHGLTRMVNAMRTARVRGLDFETSGTRFWDGQEPIGFACGFLEGVRENNPRPRAWYVPVGHRTMERQCDPSAARAAFRDIFGEKASADAGGIELVGHNIGFDLNMGRAHGWEIAQWATIHDTLVQASLINENRAFQLEKVVDELGCSPYPGGAFAGKDAIEGFLKTRARQYKLPLYRSNTDPDPNASYIGRFGHAEVPVGLEGEYSCRDIGHTLLLDWWQRLDALAAGRPFEAQRRALYENEMLLVRALADVRYVGQLVNVPYLLDLGRTLDEFLDVNGRELQRLFGVRIEWNNDSQLRDLLYKRLGMPILAETKEGQPSVDRATLMSLRSLHPGMELLGEWRAHYKVRSTYTTSLAAKVGPDGRLHSDFVQWGAGTGRLSSRDPNLQNIPARHEKLARMVRLAFIVAQGMTRVLCDYSQIELRVLGWVTGCPTFVNAYESRAYMDFLAGRIDYDTYRWRRRDEPHPDVHTNTGRDTLGGAPCGEDEPGYKAWKRVRSSAKIINFGVPYGGGPNLLSGDPNLRLSPDEAQAYFEEYHRKNPEIEQTKRFLFYRMYQQLDGSWGPSFVNWAGRMRHGPRLLWKRRKGSGCPVAEEERSMFASLVQGSAAELTKFSLVRLWWAQQTGQLPGRTVSTVHDEIAIDCDSQHTRYVAMETQRIMEDFPGTFGTIPVVADLETTTTTWADKHGYDPYAPTTTEP